MNCSTKVNFSLLVLLITFVSCRRQDILMPLAFEGEKLVVFSYLRAGQPIEVRVTKTFAPIGIPPEKNDLYIADASVEVYLNGSLQEKLIYSKNSLYVSKLGSLGKAGGIYKIIVKAKELKDAESSNVQIPTQEPIFSADNVKNLKPSINSGSPQNIVNLELLNNTTSNTNSYYYLSFLTKFKSGQKKYAQRWDEENQDDRKDAKNGCGVRKGITVDDSYGSTNLYNSGCFVKNKLSKKFSVEINLFEYDDKRQLIEKYAETIEVFYAVVDKQYWEYLNQTQPSDVERLFMDPKTSYTNIKGGYGIVAGINEKKISLPVKL